MMTAFLYAIFVGFNVNTTNKEKGFFCRLIYKSFDNLSNNLNNLFYDSY